MNFGRELKIGLLAIIVIFGMVWGYKFIIGQNLLKSSRTFYVDYTDVTALNVSSPVLVNGYQVGAVTSIKLNKNDVNKMRVAFQIENDEIQFGKDSRAILANEGLVGGKYILLDFKDFCTQNCAQSGDVLEGKTMGLLGSLMGEGELDATMSNMTKNLKEVISEIGTEGSTGAMNETFRNLQTITANLASLTASTDQLMKRSQSNLQVTLKNVADITDAISKDRERISGLLTNLDSITADIASARLSETIKNSNTAIVETTDAIKEFKNTLDVTEETMTKLGDILTKVESGEGTLAQLLTDEQLYTNLEFTSKNLALLLQDFRLNPKRYVSVSVFGKGGKEYVRPEDDPAMEGEFEIKKIKKKEDK
jgi:phospholipid/cholesterol/gamma-HCH transport system substrate-binding protein